MTLYEIDSAIMDCVDEETGEIIDLEKLEALNIERDKKVEGIALAVKNYAAEAKAIKEEGKRQRGSVLQTHARFAHLRQPGNE